MNDIDKMLRDLSNRVDIPENYNSKIDDVLKSLPEREQNSPRHGGKRINRIIGIALCVLAVVFALEVSSTHANANIFESFKMTIMDIFHIDIRDSEKNIEESGISSKEEGIAAKKDLMIELEETVIDTHGIYALIKITAPADISFNNDITFDYYGFCEGENYNSDKLIGGALDCYMLERLESRPNEALYVINLTGDVSRYEGNYVTACFKDLMTNPGGDNSEMLVQGIWSVSFQVDNTVRDIIEIDGDMMEKENMSFPYINTTAYIVSIEMSPLSISVVSDVSNMPFDELGVSDTTIELRIRMTDGSEYLVNPYREEEDFITDSGESEFNQVDGRSYQKDIYSFKEAVNINKVTGFYVQNIFIPAR